MSFVTMVVIAALGFGIYFGSRIQEEKDLKTQETEILQEEEK